MNLIFYLSVHCVENVCPDVPIMNPLIFRDKYVGTESLHVTHQIPFDSKSTVSIVRQSQVGKVFTVGNIFGTPFENLDVTVPQANIFLAG